MPLKRKVSGSWTTPANAHLKTKTPTGWQGQAAWADRPADWLPLPSRSDEHVVGLYGIWDPATTMGAKGNKVALTATGNFTVDWGDGTVENVSSGVKAQHAYTYSNIPSNTQITTADILGSAVRQVIIQVYPQAGQSITSVNLNQRHSTASPANSTFADGWLDVVVSSASMTDLNAGGTITVVKAISHSYLQQLAIGAHSLTSGSSLFKNLSALKNIPAFSTAGFTNFSDMFFGCLALTAIPEVDTSNATDVTRMFYQCRSVTHFPEIDVTGCTSISGLFVQCWALTYENIPALDTSNITNMSNLFTGCTGITQMPVFPYDTTKVTDMTALLNQTSITAAPDLDLSIVTSTGAMFAFCPNLTTVPAYVFGPDISNAVNMFSSCTSMTTAPSIDFSNALSVQGLFKGCTNLTTTPAYNFSKSTNVSEVFSGCASLTNVGDITLGAANGTMLNMFKGCASLVAAPNITTTNVVSMESAFEGCTSITSVPVYDTSKVTTLKRAFYGCTSLPTVPVWNTFTVTSMVSTFENCSSLQSVPAWNCLSVQDYSAYISVGGWMFSGCSSLTSIDIRNIMPTEINFNDCVLLDDEAMGVIVSHLLQTGGMIGISSLPLLDWQAQWFEDLINKGWDYF